MKSTAVITVFVEGTWPWNLIIEVTMSHLCLAVVRGWGTRPTLHVSGFIWVTAMFSVMAVLEVKRVGVFLVPPFGATLTILMLLPDTPVAQPYALIVGSVCGAAVEMGTTRPRNCRLPGQRTSARASLVCAELQHKL